MKHAKILAFCLVSAAALALIACFAMSRHGGGTATLEGNIIYRNEQSGVNTRPTGKEGEQITGEGTAILKGNLIFANGADLVGAEDDGSNVLSDPQLRDLQGRDFRPKAGSPAVTQEGVIGALGLEGGAAIPFDPIPDTGPRKGERAADEGEGPVPGIEGLEEDAF